MPPLTHAQARQLYDRFGSGQDRQKFYEDPAIDVLLAKAHFESAGSVFEFGCGTGRFARCLLDGYLPPSARYLGVDISSTMVGLARRRLSDWPERAEVRLTDGSMRCEVNDGCCDRFVSNYVLDLLSEEDIGVLLEEAHRVLGREGRLCLTGLTHGYTGLSRVTTWAWRRVHALRPELLGGCRPLDLGRCLHSELWQIEFEGKVCKFGISSGIVVARVRK